MALDAKVHRMQLGDLGQARSTRRSRATLSQVTDGNCEIFDTRQCLMHIRVDGLIPLAVSCKNETRVT